MDFKCVFIPGTDNIGSGRNTKKCQDHIACSYSHKLICIDDRYSKPFRTYFGEDTIDRFLNDMIKESEYCSRKLKWNLLLWLKKIVKIFIILLNIGFAKKNMKKLRTESER